MQGGGDIVSSLPQMMSYANMGGSMVGDQVFSLTDTTSDPNSSGIVDPNAAAFQTGISNVGYGPFSMIMAYNAYNEAEKNNEKVQRQLNVDAGWNQLAKKGMMPNQASYTQMMPNGGSVGDPNNIDPVYVYSQSGLKKAQADFTNQYNNYLQANTAYQDSLNLYNWSKDYRYSDNNRPVYDTLNYKEALQYMQDAPDKPRDNKDRIGFLGTPFPKENPVFKNQTYGGVGTLWGWGNPEGVEENDEWKKYRANHKAEVNTIVNKFKNQTIKPSHFVNTDNPNDNHTGSLYPIYKKPLVKPQKPTTGKRIIYDKKTHDLDLDSGWMYNIDNKSNEDALNTVIGRLTSKNPGGRSGNITLKEALEFPEEVQKKYNFKYSYDNRKMPMGGQTGFETVELEKGEPFKLPDGTIESIPISAPSHKQGGVPITLPYGTKVLGKKKAWNGKEFKEMGRKLKSSQKRYQDSLESNPTSIATNTARRMMKNINIDYGKLFDEQGVDVGSPMMSRGGKIGLRRGGDGLGTSYPEDGLVANTSQAYWQDPISGMIYGTSDYATNGIPNPSGTPIVNQPLPNIVTSNRSSINKSATPVRPVNNTNVKPTKTSSNQTNLNKNTIVYSPSTGTPDRRASSFDAYLAGEGLPLNTNNYTKSYTNPDPIKSTPLSSINNSRQSTTDWNNTLNTLGALAPTMYNMYQGLKPAKQVTENQFSNPYESMARSMMNRRKYNVQPELERNALATATYNRGLMESGASPSQMRGGRLAGLVGQRRADAETLARAQNVNAQYMADQARFEYDAGQNVAARRAMVYDLNERERAVRQNYMAAGLGQLSQYSQMNQLQNNQMLRDEQRLALLPSLTPDFTLDPSTGMMIHNPSKIQFTQDEYNKYYIKGRK